MTPHDANGLSDPFLIIKLGDHKIVDKESLRKKTLNPEFYTSYEIPTTLPGANSILTIEVWDDDGFLGQDQIGSTKIDLEDRLFSEDFNKYPVDKKPTEERTLFLPTSSAAQGIIKCWVDILEPKYAAENAKHDISKPPREDFEMRVIVDGLTVL